MSRRFKAIAAQAAALLQLRNGLTLAGNPTIRTDMHLPIYEMDAHDSLRIRKGILLHIDEESVENKVEQAWNDRAPLELSCQMFKRMEMGDYIAADLRRRGLDQLGIRSMTAKQLLAHWLCSWFIIVGQAARCNTYSVMADHRMLEDIFFMLENMTADEIVRWLTHMHQMTIDALMICVYGDTFRPLEDELMITGEDQSSSNYWQRFYMFILAEQLQRLNRSEKMEVHTLQSLEFQRAVTQFRCNEMYVRDLTVRENCLRKCFGGTPLNAVATKIPQQFVKYEVTLRKQGCLQNKQNFIRNLVQMFTQNCRVGSGCSESKISPPPLGRVFIPADEPLIFAAWVLARRLLWETHSAHSTPANTIAWHLRMAWRLMSFTDIRRLLVQVSEMNSLRIHGTSLQNATHFAAFMLWQNALLHNIACEASCFIEPGSYFLHLDGVCLLRHALAPSKSLMQKKDGCWILRTQKGCNDLLRHLVCGKAHTPILQMISGKRHVHGVEGFVSQLRAAAKRASWFVELETWDQQRTVKFLRDLAAEVRRCSE